ncbi:hypothetical protein BGZ73_002490 [Actinomortierella ambigua]|nr:hypothetical protein BGZ73_002490 [Actinomortierella ambigua]
MRFINPFRQDTDEENSSDDETSVVADASVDENRASTVADHGDVILTDEGHSGEPITPIVVDDATSPIPDMQKEVSSQSEHQTDNSQATLVASLQAEDSAIVADESEEFSVKKSMESDRSSQVEVIDDVEVSAQAADQPTKGSKRSKRSRGKRSESPAPSATETSPLAPLTTRITRRSTRSQTLKMDEPQDDSSSRQATPTPSEPQETMEKSQEEPQEQPSEDIPSAAGDAEQETAAAAPETYVEVVLESKKTRSSKKSKGKKGRKKSVVDRRANEPEPSDDDKDEIEEPAPAPKPTDEATTSSFMEIDEEVQAPVTQDTEETATAQTEETVEYIDRFYAHQLEEMEAREELEKEEFFTSTQFEELEVPVAAAEDEEDEDMVKYYPPEPEGQEEEEENAETIKYYPPSEGDDERDPRSIYGLADADLETATTTTSVSLGHGSDAEEEESSSSVGYHPSSIVLDSLENSPAPSFEFSPMQTPTDSPAATPGPSRLRITEDDEDEEVQKTETHARSAEKRSSLATEAPQAEDKPATVESLRNLSAHPTHNLEVLIAFFQSRKGMMLTRGESDTCHRLIEDCTESSGHKRNFWWKKTKATEKETEEPKQAPSSETKPTIASSLSRPRLTLSRPAPPVQPMLMKRQAPDDTETDSERVKRRASSKPFSMDEYLEIEKYRGVEWDDLPDYLKIRRQIEWKGTEPPEVVEQRELERQRRRDNEEAAAKFRQYQAQKEARQAAKRAKEAEAAAVEADAKAWRDLQSRKHARTTETQPDRLASSESESESEPMETAGDRKGEEASKARKKAATTSKNVLKDDEDSHREQPAYSSVAQMMLSVVGKSAVAESEKAKTPAGLSSTSAPQTSTTIRIDAAGSSPFSFAPITSKKTDSDEGEEEQEHEDEVQEKDFAATTVEKSAPLSLAAIRKEAADAAASASSTTTTSSIFAVPVPGSLFATPAATSESASDLSKKKETSAIFKVPSLSPAPAAPLFGTSGSTDKSVPPSSSKESKGAPGLSINFGAFSSTSTTAISAPLGASTSLFGAPAATDDKKAAPSTTTSIPFGNLQSSSPFGAKITPTFGFSSQGQSATTITTTTTTTTTTSKSITPAVSGSFDKLGSATTSSSTSVSNPFAAFGARKETDDSSKTTTAPAFSATPSFGKTPADRLKLRDGAGSMLSTPSSAGDSPAVSSLASPMGSPFNAPDYGEDAREEDYEDEGVVSKSSQGSYGRRSEEEQEGDEDGQSYNEGSVPTEGEGSEGFYGTDEDADVYSGRDDDDEQEQEEEKEKEKEKQGPAQSVFSTPGPFNFGVPTSGWAASSSKSTTATTGATGGAFSAFSSSFTTTATTATTTTTSSSTAGKGFSFGGTTTSEWTKTSKSTTSTSSPTVAEFEFSFEGEGDDEGEGENSSVGQASTFGKVEPSRLGRQRSSISEYERSPERFMAAAQDTEEGTMSPLMSPLASPVLSSATRPF